MTFGKFPTDELIIGPLILLVLVFAGIVAGSISAGVVAELLTLLMEDMLLREALARAEAMIS